MVVGIPEGAPAPIQTTDPGSMIAKEVSIQAIAVGDRRDAIECLDMAARGVKEQSENFMTLNGMWRFSWVRHAEARPTDFWRTDFNDRGWDSIPVPGVWNALEIDGRPVDGVGFATYRLRVLEGRKCSPFPHGLCVSEYVDILMACEKIV